MGRSGIRNGTLLINSLHTTIAIFVNEFQSALLDDLGAVLQRLIPRRDGYLPRRSAATRTATARTPTRTCARRSWGARSRWRWPTGRSCSASTRASSWPSSTARASGGSSSRSSGSDSPRPARAAPRNLTSAACRGMGRLRPAFRDTSNRETQDGACLQTAALHASRRARPVRLRAGGDPRRRRRSSPSSARSSTSTSSPRRRRSRPSSSRSPCPRRGSPPTARPWPRSGPPCSSTSASTASTRRARTWWRRC